jgi:hypothetical protein
VRLKADLRKGLYKAFEPVKEVLEFFLRKPTAGRKAESPLLSFLVSCLPNSDPHPCFLRVIRG